MASGGNSYNDMIWVKVWLLLLSVMLFLPFNLLATNQTIQIEYITINDGLSDNYVTHIQQDRFGYMWFGTMEGLNRYNGQSFVAFRTIPFDSTSISDNFIRCFDEDSKGNLYITTNTGGLNYYDRRQEQFKRIDLESESGTDFNSLSFVRCDGDSIVWVGTQDGYLLRYNSQADSLERYLKIEKDHPNKNPNMVCDIYPDSTGSVWIASSLGGLDYLSFPRGQLNHILSADTLAEPFRRDGCNRFAVDKKGSFWISRVSGLDNYNPLTGQNTHYGFLDSKGEMLKSFSMLIDSHGDILLNSYYDLIKFHPETGAHELITSILPNYFTAALYVDPTGIIWAGTMGWGVVKIDPQKSQFHTSRGNFLNHLYPEEINLLSQQVEIDLNIRDRDFLSVIRDRAGDVWVATQFWGLYHIDQLTGRYQKYTMGEPDLRQRYQVMYEVFEDHDGAIWVSTVGGISKLNKATGDFDYHRIYPGTDTDKFAINKATYLDISCIYEDKQGLFWLGTPELGLIRFDPGLDSISVFPLSVPSEEMHPFPILSLSPDPDNSNQILWLGTDGGGLVRFDPETGQTRSISEQDGLPNNVVNGVLSGNDNDLWMSTNMGLSRYFTRTSKFQNFDIRDGLQSNGFNRREFFKTEAGELFFGGSYGYNHFFPGSIAENNPMTPIVLTGIDLLNKAISFDDSLSLLNAPLSLLKELTLNHEQGMMVTLYYSALSFSNSHRDRFAYKLEGLDPRWIDNGTKRSAVYTNLSPGRYQFLVRHIDELGSSDLQELSLNIIVLPPFWATWWFRMLLLVLGLSLTGLFIWQLFKRLQKKRIRQQQFSQQLLAYQEDERKRISGALHDGVGQNLLVIKNMLQLGLNQLIANDSTKENFQSASTIVSETIQEVREISHNLIPQHLEQLGLTSTLESVIENIERACEINFTVEIEDIDDLLPPESEILVYRIVQESLNNIIKHSQANAAAIKIQKDANHISIRVSDNGIGFPPALSASSRGIGISGMQERAQLLQGKFSVKQGKHSGTVVQLTIELDP